MKVLYNNQYGGFNFSDELLREFGIEEGCYKGEGYRFCQDPDNRTNPKVIEAVERMGLEAASGDCCTLAIEEIGDNDIYTITQFDGLERVRYVCTAINNRLVE